MAGKVIFTKHAQARLKVRKMSRQMIVDIVKRPEESYIDLNTNSRVAIATKEYGGKRRKIGVFFHRADSGDKIVHTFHPETENEINNRLNKERYKKNKI